MNYIFIVVINILGFILYSIGLREGRRQVEDTIKYGKVTIIVKNIEIK